MSRTRVKICGITRAEDATAAALAGADALGFVFYSRSPRAIEATAASEILAGLPAFVSSVGLFVNADAAAVDAVLAECTLDVLQFHGDESPDFCRQFGRPYLKALRMRDGVDVSAFADRYHDAKGLLLDSYRPGTPGGTGEIFDWQRIPAELCLPLVLAGGLKAENIGDAIHACKPWAVDVSGGVESGPGIKSQQQITDFIDAVSRADRRE